MYLRGTRILEIFKSHMLEDLVDLKSRPRQLSPTFLPLGNYSRTLSNNFSTDQSVGHVVGSRPSGCRNFLVVGNLGHMRRNFPQSHLLEFEQQPSRAIVAAGNVNNCRDFHK